MCRTRYWKEIKTKSTLSIDKGVMNVKFTGIRDDNEVANISIEVKKNDSAYKIVELMQDALWTLNRILYCTCGTEKICEVHNISSTSRVLLEKVKDDNKDDNVRSL